MTAQQETIFREIATERAWQEATFGQQDYDDFIYLAILTEEVGEAAQAALQDMFGGVHAGSLREEVLHVAAVAVKWIEKIDRHDEAMGLRPKESTGQ